MQDPQIFLSSSGALVRFAEEEALLYRDRTKVGGAVAGPLMRRLSVMLCCFTSKLGVQIK